MSKTNVVSGLIIESERLRLEVPALEHYDAWAEAHRKVGGKQVEFGPKPRDPERCSLEDYEALLKQIVPLLAAQNIPMHVIRKEDGALLGVVSLFDRVGGPSQSVFIGYRIFSSHWRQGYATEAVRAAVEAAFTVFDLHRVEACVELNNAASIAVLDKLGFRREGLSKRRLRLREDWRDVWVYAMTSEERGHVWTQSP